MFSDAAEGTDATPSLTPNLNLDGFAGSLDFLLRVARAHQINLAALSIVDMVTSWPKLWNAHRQKCRWHKKPARW